MKKHLSDEPCISIVVPCYNEEGNVGVLCSELKHHLAPFPYELIFVDDGSSDTTLSKIKQLEAEDKTIKHLSLSRNFGHQKALIAGLRNAKGDAVIMMDADLQHPASVIPKLTEKWQEGYDVVNTHRKSSCGTNWFKRATSHIFYRLIGYLTDLKMSNGFADFRLLDRRVVDFIKNSKEEDIFIRGLVCWYGFRQAIIDYDADKRFSGKTKYSFGKMLMLSMNGITAFSIRPLRLSLLLASILVLFCLAEIIYALYIWITHGAVSGWTSTVILISLIGAMNMLMLGIIGEYVGRTFMQSKGRPMYIISEWNIDNDKLS